MKSMKRTEEFIRAGKRRQITSSQMDEETIRDCFDVIGQTDGTKPTICGVLTSWKFLKPGMIAAVAIIAIGLLVAHWSAGEKTEQGEQMAVENSPARLLTAASLSITYRRGGMEAVEEQYKRAFEGLGPRPAPITIKELLAEQNGI